MDKMHRVYVTWTIGQLTIHILESHTLFATPFNPDHSQGLVGVLHALHNTAHLPPPYMLCSPLVNL